MDTSRVTSDSVASDSDTVDQRDDEWVTACLGRRPRSDYTIAVRDDLGRAAVMANPPFLDDGTPMPTRYWLLEPTLSRMVGTLESEGGVRRSEKEVDAATLRRSHERYAAQRDLLIAGDHLGPRPSGGVGGTRVGVKCLHTHVAWHLAGGDDPVGRWALDELWRDDGISDPAAAEWLGKQRWILERHRRAS